MQNTEDLYTQFATTVDLRKYFSEHCRAASKFMDNRWKYVRDDFCYLLDHWEMLQHLEYHFKRGVTGILNNSYGIIWDTAVTIVSRSFDDETIPIRWALWNIFQSLIEENINKFDWSHILRVALLQIWS
ncbi:hypothetical protein F8M41_024385 [Gigaspora margarita]|uniref:Uncharacterized protein n=1 Tax=Gigaspora margarita TaxID=4874 RepID=A0A8H4ABP2_GIGMA|nr:hypothetical protein F8M41_024385 [Gigaspora margarita]